MIRLHNHTLTCTQKFAQSEKSTSILRNPPKVRLHSASRHAF